MVRVMRCFSVAILFVLITGAPGDSNGQADSRLKGTVRSHSGEPLAGILVRAEREASAADTSVITVTAYTNREGRYAYRELPDGIYQVGIHTPGFEVNVKQRVEVAGQGSETLDMTAHPRQPAIENVTAAELLNALPGTKDQKAVFERCGNCHSLKFVLQQRKRTRDEWFKTIERMRIKNNDAEILPVEMHQEILDETRDENNKLADYIAGIHGNDSKQLSLALLPRPTEDASTRIEVTEYALRRGAPSVAWRGDPRAPWLHDVMPDAEGRYVWYTDHFTNSLGRLDPKTGEIVEFGFPQAKPGRPGGSHGLRIDQDGNIWIGILWQGTIGKFDPKTEKFTQWVVDDVSLATERFGIFDIDPRDGVLSIASSPTSSLFRLNPATGEFTPLPLPDKRGAYGVATDSKGLVYYAQLNGGRIGQYNPATNSFKVWKTPTPDAGPRRTDIDAEDRFWFGEFYAGNLGMFDPATETIREWPVPGWHEHVAPYDVSVDNKNRTVWTHDFTNERLYRFDMKTEKFTEFMLPIDVEIRHLVVDSSKMPVTVWIPDYTPPGRILRVQVW